MTQLAHETVECPRCGASKSRQLFRSLSGDRMEAQVAAILDGTFERMECAACAHSFQPEHRMLFAHAARATWIVMYPRARQQDFAIYEHDLSGLFQREFARAPAELSEHLAPARPRLVFGQHMLAEAVRQSEAGLDPVALECAKLLVYRRRVAQLMRYGPMELSYAGRASATELRLAIHDLATGERAADLTVATDILGEVAAAGDEFQHRYPELFANPYISATRYLFGPRRSS